MYKSNTSSEFDTVAQIQFVHYITVNHFNKLSDDVLKSILNKKEALYRLLIYFIKYKYKNN